MTYFWLAIFASALALEAITLALVSIWFAVGAVTAMVFAFFGADIVVQTAAFFVVSVFFLLLFLLVFKKKLNKKEIKTNANALVNTFGVVEENIGESEKGRVTVSAMSWQAQEEKGQKLQKGDRVEILDIKGVTLIVKKKEEEKNEQKEKEESQEH